jgi:hypothetical protein
LPGYGESNDGRVYTADVDIAGPPAMEAVIDPQFLARVARVEERG